MHYINKTKTTFITLLLLASILFLITACGEAGTTSEESEDQSDIIVDTEETTAEEGDTLLNLAANPSGTTWNFYLNQMANVMNENVDGLTISAQESGGSNGNAIALSEKDIDLGFTEALVAYESYNGEGRFEGEANPDLRLLWFVAHSSLHWAVTKDSGIKTFEDLNGKEFNPSTVGGGGEYITELVFDHMGISPDYHRAQLSDAAELVRNNQLNGFTYNATPPDPTFTEVNVEQPLHMLSLDDDQLDSILEEFPFFVDAVIPDDAYDGVDEAQTIGVWMGAAILKEIDQELVYEMSKAYWENIEEVAEVFPLASESTPEQAIETATIPLHAGVVQYYEEIGLDVPEELIPPEYEG
ncbi:TAXI family TRAP transporter solute-binding subunit [Alteribacillus sp. YIM 98480]|uniref:TAXI family TRAP transporter solute-binding subunit n=1 Tax=Alteribacillus sp. YIM 98480 TaxID=2606599 RepID=UPI00131ACBB2|nr:TAXI family TRAP transporter solute-binding subunit [Alteribacillus sp. YIM 98480]